MILLNVLNLIICSIILYIYKYKCIYILCMKCVHFLAIIIAPFCWHCWKICVPNGLPPDHTRRLTKITDSTYKYLKKLNLL